MGEPRLTIAIPLHGGARWIEGVRDTVSKAPAWSRVVISDASRLDDTADRLAEIYRSDPRVSVVSRAVTVGWVEHANQLLEEASTELFCWMPQDDLVSPDNYFEILVSALDDDPERVLAFPTVVRRISKGWARRREPGPAPFRSPPTDLGGKPAGAAAVKLLRAWNLGLAWRGVFRTTAARRIPDTSFCPDVLWAFSMALAGNLAWVPEARYLKRYHRGSALHSMDWQGMESAKRLYRTEVEARLGDEPERARRVMKDVSRFLALYQFRSQYMQLRSLAAGMLGVSRTAYE